MNIEKKTCKDCVYAKKCVMYEPKMKRCKDYKNAAMEAAKLLKEYCSSIDCQNCIFHTCRVISDTTCMIAIGINGTVQAPEKMGGII